MRSKFLLFFFLTALIPMLIGCSNIKDSLSEEKAKQLVIEKHTNPSHGTPSILNIEVKYNSYYVDWENKENKESGTDKVTKNGEVIMVEARIE